MKRENIIPISDEMKTSYLEYAMSVIVSRAVPDVRDGLKPVHRRILFAMDQISAHHNKSYKKSARIVGEVIGKYHPHGDSSIYDALVRMAQDFSVMSPLIDGQGNFGSVDNDPPASMRYTEARLSHIASKMLEDLEKCIDMKPNYDNTEKEPSVLPAAFPNLIVNGSDGIAVGMATSIPTHNLSEVIDATVALIDNNAISDSEMIDYIKGPDLPTGGIIVNKSDLKGYMLAGRGSVMLRGLVSVETDQKGRDFIIIKEIPYQVVKAKMIERMAELVRDKKIDSISFIRDESNKDGIRVVIGVKKNFSTEILLNQLYKYTQLQTSISYNNLVLNKGKPELMGIPKMIRVFLEFREEIITRIKKYYLNKARDRAHVVIGLHVAIDSIDKIISIIRNSSDSNEAKEKLMKEKWKATDIVVKMISLVEDKKNEIVDGFFMFTENQVKSILEMRLSRLTGLESDKIQQELNELADEIKDHLSVLSDRNKLLSIIKEELLYIKEKFGRERLTKIEDLMISDDEDSLMEPEDMLVMVSKKGYIKRTDLSAYRTQKRGGMGKNASFGTSSVAGDDVEDDFVSNMFISSTVDTILFFTNLGRVYKLKTHKIPLTSQNAKGRAIVNLLNVNEDEFITSFVVMKKEYQENLEMKYLIFSTKLGNIRKSSVDDFVYIPSNGKNAISLADNDALVAVELASDEDNVLLATNKGMATRFSVSDLRLIKSRSSCGVIGMSLDMNDSVISMCILPNNENELAIKDEFLKQKLQLRISVNKAKEENEFAELRKEFKSDLFDFEKFKLLAKDERFLLTINTGGFGKRTSSYEYRITKRAGKGIINADTEKGDVVSVFIVEEGDELMITCKSGKMIRCSVKNIPIISRNTKGVTLINTKNNDEVVSVAKVCSLGGDSENVVENDINL